MEAAALTIEIWYINVGACLGVGACPEYYTNDPVDVYVASSVGGNGNNICTCNCN